jgi:hypothetical protein
MYFEAVANSDPHHLLPDPDATFIRELNPNLTYYLELYQYGLSM